MKHDGFKRHRVFKQRIHINEHIENNVIARQCTIKQNMKTDKQQLKIMPFKDNKPLRKACLSMKTHEHTREQTSF